MKVLIVEDDRILGESVKDFLEDKGVIVDWIDDPREVMDLLSVSSYDVIVLDLIMPYIKGEDLLSMIREKDKKTPILVLTAKRRIYDKEVCFERGADDYLTKPFDPVELFLRIKALRRRVSENRKVSIEDVEIDLTEERVWKSGKEIVLGKKDWMLLKFLVENEGRILSQEEIMNYVWGDEPVCEDVVRAHIKNLRRILPKDCIETYRGRGYRFVRNKT